MTIGFSDGTQADSRIDYLIGNNQDSGVLSPGKNQEFTNPDAPVKEDPNVAPQKYERMHQDFEQRWPKDFIDQNELNKTIYYKPQVNPPGGGVPDVTPRDAQPPRDRPYGVTDIDRNHHVPLVASAVMDDTGQMEGLAIDHRIPPHPEYEHFLRMHEGTELPLMQSYIADGMKEQDAYHKAHDIATAVETAAVRKHTLDTGQNPDEYQDKYKQFWRDAASIARTPTHVDTHPNAHTTVYGLDDAELGNEYKVAENMHNKPLAIDVLQGAHIMGPENIGAGNVGRLSKVSKPANDTESTEPKWPPTQDDLKYARAVAEQKAAMTGKPSTYNSGEKWVKVNKPGYGTRYVKEKNAWKYGNENEGFGVMSKISDWVKDEFGNLTRVKKDDEE